MYDDIVFLIHLGDILNNTNIEELIDAIPYNDVVKEKINADRYIQKLKNLINNKT